VLAGSGEWQLCRHAEQAGTVIAKVGFGADSAVRAGQGRTAGVGWGEPTFAEMGGKEEDAPNPAVRLPLG
jgi:hypothetical protein